MGWPGGLARGTAMKNLTTGLALVLLAAGVFFVWRLDRRLAPLAALAEAQLAERAEQRRETAARRAAEQQAEHEARLQAERTAEREAAAAAEDERRARVEAARQARLLEPVKVGEVVPEIVLDNRETVRAAVVVAVQRTSVSFKAGSRLYNLPTDQLPAELRVRLGHMFPPPAAPAQPPAP